jgi:single-strand DNA-binding protein
MDFNRVIMVGRLASDPELKYTPSGIAVTQFRMAVNRPMSAEARSSGQEKQADFFSIVAWRQSAEYAANYLGKGRLVLVEGRLQVREYVTQAGEKRRDTEVVVDNLKSLDRPKEGEEGGMGGSQGGSGYSQGGRSQNGGGYNQGGQGGGQDEYADADPGYGGNGSAATAPAPTPARAPVRPAAAPPARPAANKNYQPPADDDMDDPFADN